MKEYKSEIQKRLVIQAMFDAIKYVVCPHDSRAGGNHGFFYFPSQIYDILGPEKVGDKTWYEVLNEFSHILDEMSESNKGSLAKLINDAKPDTGDMLTNHGYKYTDIRKNEYFKMPFDEWEKLKTDVQNLVKEQHREEIEAVIK